MFRLFLLPILLAYSFGELIISEFDNNKHLLVSDDLTFIRKVDIKKEHRPEVNLVARKTDEGIILYNSNNDRIQVSLMSTNKIVETGNITIKDHVLEWITNFDVQPSGEFVAISSGSGTIYLFSQRESKTREIHLKINFSIKSIQIHPTKRIIYYSSCEPNYEYLFAYDVDQKTSKKYQIPACLYPMSLDYKKNIIWARTRDDILAFDMNNSILEKFAVKTEMSSNIALAQNHVYCILNGNRDKEVYKLRTNDITQKFLALSDYTVQPFLTYLKAKQPILINIDDGLIELLGPKFEALKNKIKLNIDKRSIKSVRSVSDQVITTLYWIHDFNGGVIQYAKMDNNFVVKERSSFLFATDESKDIVDFDIDSDNKNIYVAFSDGILKVDLNALKQSQNVPKFEGIKMYSIMSIGVYPKKKKLVLSECSGKLSRLAMMDFDFKNKRYVSARPGCSMELQVDQEDDRLFMTTLSGLYSSDFNMEYEKLCSDKNIFSFVHDQSSVYFVSKSNGPGIYGTPKRRGEIIKHDLPIDDDGSYGLTYVKLSASKSPTLSNSGAAVCCSKYLTLILFIYFSIMKLLK